MKDAYNVKIELKTLTIHDLKQVIDAFLNEDFWTPEQGIEIETIEYEPKREGEE